MPNEQGNRPLRIQRIGLEESPWEDLYHRLLTLSWPQFFLLLSCLYLAVNAVFAELYLLLPGAIANLPPGNYMSAFAFSVQTTSTIGYGNMYPVTWPAHVVVTVQALFSLFYIAGLTGLIFAKFARPSARVVFSNRVLWTEQNGHAVLSLRLGNIRTNQVYQGRASLTLLRDEISSEGENLRRLVDLPLIRDETPIFTLSWTLFHRIDDKSPFRNLTLEQVRASNWELLVTFNGLDQEMAQTVAVHSTYSAEHIVRAKKFVDMIQVDRGLRIVDFSKLHEIEIGDAT